MKRSDLYIRLTTGVLFLAVASYVGVYIYNALVNPYSVTTAFSYSIEETLPVQGYVVRTEMVLVGTGAAVLPVVSEGEKVAVGQPVAVEYTGREALETASELRALRLQIAQLEAIGRGNGEAAGLESVMALSEALQRGDFRKLDELLVNVEANVLSAHAPAPELPELKARLESLENRTSGVTTIYAPVSGTFSQAIDGYEHIAPGALAGISPTDFSELFSTRYIVSGAGKLVTEFKWYFAAVMPAEDAARLTSGNQMPIQFSGAYGAKAEMLVESTGRKEDGACVVLFSSDRGIYEVASLRQMNAEIVFGAISGLHVPKEALRLDEGGATFVFLQTGVRAERVDVEILGEFGDSYIVRDGLEAGTPLRAGSTVIVKANNLYDGKVVAK